MSRKLVVDMSKERDPHRAFVTQLAEELLSGKWMEAPSDRRMLYENARTGNSVDLCGAATTWSMTVKTPDIVDSPQNVCTTVSSKQLFTESKKRRQCVVCRWENRLPTVVTDHCTLHNVCLCQLLHTAPERPYFCQTARWTCWEKFHDFYLPRNLFSVKGNIMKASELYKLKQSDSTLPPPQTIKGQAARRIL